MSRFPFRWFRKPPERTYEEGARDGLFQTINVILHDYEKGPAGQDIERIVISPSMFRHLQNVMAGHPMENFTKQQPGNMNPENVRGVLLGFQIAVQEDVMGITVGVRKATPVTNEEATDRFVEAHMPPWVH